MSQARNFAIDGTDIADELYHYRACGLDNVYLVNGFSIEDTGYGEGVCIDSVEELHQAIGDSLIQQPQPLSPREFRFLRKHMGYSQEKLAKSLCVSAQTIARYEKEQTSIPGLADKCIRILYGFSLLPRNEQEELLEIFKADIRFAVKRKEKSAKYFTNTEKGWVQ
ncbi:MAG: helix-turn-helix domain-containing protein [Pseudomonadota bacterium]